VEATNNLLEKEGNKMQVTWATFQKLNAGNIVKNVPESAGVYLLWVQLKDEKWKCYYVGKAENLQSRLLQHCSVNEENDCIKNNVQNYISGYEFSEVAKQADRAGIEKFLYDYYKKPECNKQDPGGETISVNLP
jgi:excinuclease UvrABC nuclease subunit